MKIIQLELYKQKRCGIIIALVSPGILGAIYAIINFIVRQEALLSLPLKPMDILLTQLYGIIMIINMFAIIITACTSYNIEFKGNALRKMYMMPISIAKMYLSKFIILSLALMLTIVIQHLTLAGIGMKMLEQGNFKMLVLWLFAGYSYITAMPVLSFMLLLSSRFENMWITLGIGVIGFLSAMSLGTLDLSFLLLDPFVIMIKPAIAMSSIPDIQIIIIAVIETLFFLIIGFLMSKHLHYE